MILLLLLLLCALVEGWVVTLARLLLRWHFRLLGPSRRALWLLGFLVLSKPG